MIQGFSEMGSLFPWKANKPKLLPLLTLCSRAEVSYFLNRR